MAFTENFARHKWMRQARSDSFSQDSCANSDLMTLAEARKATFDVGSGYPLANALPFLSSGSLEKFFIKGVVP